MMGDDDDCDGERVVSVTFSFFLSLFCRSADGLHEVSSPNKMRKAIYHDFAYPKKSRMLIRTRIRYQALDSLGLTRSEQELSSRPRQSVLCLKSSCYEYY